MSRRIFFLFSIFVSTSALADGLRFMTYNVWGLPPPLLQIPQRFAEIRAEVPSYNADIIGFNETFASQTQILAKIPGYKYVARGPAGNGLFKQSSGLLLLSRYPIIGIKTMKFNVCSGNDCLANKGILFVRLQPPAGPTVNVFITHTNAGAAEAVRVTQAQQLRQFIRAHDDGSPVVVMGDLNTDEGSDSYKLYTEEEGLTDTHREWANAHSGLSPNEAQGLTYVTNRSEDPTVLEKGWRFDYILARTKRALGISDSRVIFKTKSNGHYLSDHYGYLAELEL